MLKVHRFINLTKCIASVRTKIRPVQTCCRRALATQRKSPLKVTFTHHNSIRCSIHLSPKHQINPLFLLYLKTAGLKVGKYGSMLISRTLGKRYKKLPLKQRNLVKNIVRTIAGASLACIAYYTYTHYETTPITGRKRLITFTKEQMMAIADEGHSKMQEEEKAFLLPENDNMYIQCKRVLDNLVRANQDVEGIKDVKWELNVVHKNTNVSAFVFPNGQVYVYTGMMKFADNDDELAVVIGHEMSHVLLGHTQV